MFKQVGLKAFLRALSLALVSLIMIGCSDSSSKNNNPLSNYRSSLYSDSEFTTINNYAKIDSIESYAIGVAKGDVVFGNASNFGKVNWGLAKSISPASCENENFWSASTLSLVEDSSFKGLVTKLTSIQLDTSNFAKSRVSILGQYTAVFNDEDVATSFFAKIMASLALCGKNVFGINQSGEKFQVTLKNTPAKNFQYFSVDQNAVMRVSQDGLILADLFVKTRFSITLFKLFINDMNLPNMNSWSVLNGLAERPLESLCKLEDCISPIINLATSQRISG